MLEIIDLTKIYDASESPALEGFSLSVSDGEFVSLIGPSGCGKTTVLRIIGGLLPPTRGEVTMNGEPSLAPSPDKAIVFQLFNLFPWRTALANVAYGLELQGVPKPTRLAVAREYLELVGLGHRADHYPGQLSGGESQRIGLARALAIEPKLLLMDEPFGSLDALTREHLQVMLQEICEARRLTVLFVTHSIDEAIFLSDRMVVMGVPGHVIMERQVQLQKPRTAFDWRATGEYQELRRETSGHLVQQFAKANAGS